MSLSFLFTVVRKMYDGEKLGPDEYAALVAASLPEVLPTVPEVVPEPVVPTKVPVIEVPAVEPSVIPLASPSPIPQPVKKIRKLKAAAVKEAHAPVQEPEPAPVQEQVQEPEPAPVQEQEPASEEIPPVLLPAQTPAIIIAELTEKQEPAPAPFPPTDTPLVKKKGVVIKSKEVKTPKPVATDPYAIYHVQSIQPTLCIARKMADECIQGTEKAKIYAETQCTRKKQKNSDYCSFCAKKAQKWQETQKEKTWLGRLDEPVLDHVKVVGSKWYREAYPQGFPFLPKEDVAVPVETPVEECVLEETEEVQTAEWIPFMSKKGIPMIRSLKTNNVYRADMNEDGEGMIMWEHFQGKWENGDINVYGTEA